MYRQNEGTELILNLQPERKNSNPNSLPLCHVTGSLLNLRSPISKTVFYVHVLLLAIAPTVPYNSHPITLVGWFVKTLIGLSGKDSCKE